MAKQFINDKGFLIIKLNKEEANFIGFGFSGDCLCMSCNNVIKDNMYYIAVLNDCMCKDCLDKFLKEYTRHQEDIPYEKRNFNFYTKKLNINIRLDIK